MLWFGIRKFVLVLKNGIAFWEILLLVLPFI